MPKIKVNGVQMYFESHGEGFPLVLCYGLGGNTNEWRPQIPALSKGYRLILWDPRGHGKSDSPKKREMYGPDISAEDLLGLMNHLRIDKAHVGGLSMGGGIAARFTLAHPERVESLLIIDSASASGLPISQEQKAMREKTVELALTEGMEAVARYSIEANPNIGGRAKQGPEAVKGIMDMYLPLDPVGYAHSVWTLVNAPSTSKRLSEIKAPTLVLVGEDDPAVAAAKFTHQQIAGSKLVIIQKAGHLSNLDQPEVFNDEVLKFLDGVEQRKGRS